MFRTGTLDSAEGNKTTSQAQMALWYYAKYCMAGPWLTVAVCHVPFRRLEDHIKDLCAKIVAVRESELQPVLSELKSALHKHNTKLRRLAAEKLTGLEPPPSERRKEQ